ncbi:MAG: YiiX/YebB-like N1pC/P60 family cysteine hydrolase [Ferruginibacter sp.]
MNKFTNTTIRWLSGCLIFFAAACEHKSAYRSFTPTKEDSLLQAAIVERAFIQIAGIKNIIQTGDLVTRTGNDFTSQSLRSLNQRDHTYSHCGIASIEHDSIFIYHALGGDFNPDQKIRRDLIEDFAEPYNNKGIGIYRFGVADSTKQNFALVAKAFYNQGVMFDMDFDLKTDDRMYCAEFVYKSFMRASWNKLVFDRSHIKLFEFIGVDDIFLHPLCKLQAQLVYK